ncbi:MAG: hypothetical protein A3F61_00045 [Candidatus Blackburnbacteria bacterium RIFCSPHIGHO2_12_FULL_41_13b]|uniref:Uncharacterized protein n=1 Tax=Candidatus Blackburnbacteria bacterium RIFCSPHIGHO2_12_FULL_41_13b TaxID=1797517 RepID=A0A1G1V6A9_9BACT|nr:MAG: hypothetical protein A3F61_00045 [Candidatus Blackburnbacteria bacterium RIFCSPHIGHO2_12_FULL_41_13b]
MSVEIKPDSTALNQFLLKGHELIQMPDGRILQASGLCQDRIMVSLGNIFVRTFGCTPDYRSGFYQKVLEIVAIHNAVNPEHQLHPVVTEQKPTRHYLIHKDESEDLGILLTEHTEFLDPLLPFRVTGEEIDDLKQGKVKVKQIVTKRLYKLAKGLLSEFSESQARTVAFKVIEHPSTWKLLLESTPPISEKSDFQRYFRTSLVRRVWNCRRDKERAGKRVGFYRLNNNPLKDFFEQNPLGSQLSEKLLSVLPQDEISAFIGYYLLNKSRKTLEQERGKTLNEDERPYVKARNILEEVVRLPIEDWPRPAIVITIDRIFSKRREEFDQITACMFPRYQEYAGLKYRQGFSNEQLAEHFNINVGAVKALGHRFRDAFIKLALKGQVINSSEVDFK